MRYWIKLYTEILDDPKMGRLSDREYRTCINLFALAGRHDKGGTLPPISDIAWTLRLSQSELEADMRALQQVDILEEHDGIWVIRKWQERQAKAPSAAPDKVAERVRNHRQRQRNEHVTTLHPEVKRGVTPPEKNINNNNNRNGNGKVTLPVPEPCKAYDLFLQARGGAVNALDAQSIGDLVDTYGDEAVCEAIRIGNQNKRQGFLSLTYLTKILQGYQQAGGKFKQERGGLADAVEVFE